jgi:hypothetical protein
MPVDNIVQWMGQSRPGGQVNKKCASAMAEGKILTLVIYKTSKPE